MRADHDPVPRRLAAAVRLRAVHLGAGRHLVRAEGLLRVLHVRHGEGVRAALPLRPADAARLEGLPADVAGHGGHHRGLPQAHGAGMMSAGIIGALVGLVLAAVDFLLLRMLASRVDFPRPSRLEHYRPHQFVLLADHRLFRAPYVIGE